MSYQKKCETCGLLDPMRNMCLLTGRQVDPAADFCSNHNDQQYHCEVCNRQILTPIYDMTNPDKPTILCEECLAAISSCQGCIHNCGKCAFETDPSPIPLFIQKQIRQGPITTVTNVPNPERIRQVCQNGCQCYDPENWCFKQSSGICSNYKCVLDQEES